MTNDDMAFFRQSLISLQESMTALTASVATVSATLTAHMANEEGEINDIRSGQKELFKLIRSGLAAVLMLAISGAGWLLVNANELSFIKTGFERELPSRLAAIETSLSAIAARRPQ